MANQSLISGEKYAVTGGNQQGGFIDIADTMSKPLQQASEGIEQVNRERQVKLQKEEAKAKAIDAKIGGYIGKMKSDIDLVGISAEQQASIRNFLLSEKAKYVEAANAIVNYSASDPEYLQLTEVMNGVNNSFANLANNIKVYKENQINFVDDFKNGVISNGDLVSKSQASTIYDPTEAFKIEGGDLIFNVDGSDINFRDFKNPAGKAYKTADSIMKIANSLYAKGQKLTPLQIQTVRNQLDEQLSTNPDSIKSLIADNLLASTRLDIDPDMVNNVADSGELKELVLNKLLEGIQQTANAGYAEKQRIAASISSKRSPVPKVSKIYDTPVLNSEGENEYRIEYKVLNGGIMSRWVKEDEYKALKKEQTIKLNRQ